MRFGDTIGTRRIVRAYPGLKGASVGSVLKTSTKLLVAGKLLRMLKEQKALDDLLQSSLRSLEYGKKGTIVQIGANDGQHSDALRDILVSMDVRAVLVEPMPIAFKALSKLYPDKSKIQLVNAAISAKGGKLVLYTPEIKGSELQSTLWACTSPEQALREVERIMGRNTLKVTTVTKLSIESRTPSQLCKGCNLNLKDIKVLVCDTEGQDADIVGSFFDAGARPEVVFYERLHVPPNVADTLNERLDRLGYVLRESNKDVYAVQQSRNESAGGPLVRRGSNQGDR